MTRVNTALFTISLIFLILAISACSPISRPEQQIQTDTILLKPGDTIGQTLVANFDGLTRVTLALAPTKQSAAPTGSLIFHIRHAPREDEDLATATLPISTIDEQRYYSFDIPTQEKSRLKDYYFFIENASSHPITVSTAPLNVYLDGAAYKNHKPLKDRQLTFLLGYSPQHMFVGLIQELTSWLGYLLLSVLLFIIPGYSILHWVQANNMIDDKTTATVAKYGFAELGKSISGKNFWLILALSIGISLAIYPILFQIASILGIHLGAWHTWVPLLASILYLLFQKFRRKQDIIIFGMSTPSASSIPSITALIILILIIFSRFWTIRNLEAPMWGDGYHHTVIVDLILKNAGLINSWQPVADVDKFTYHFGFHAITAVFAWASNLEPRFATLWAGQIINILAILTLLPLSSLLCKNPWMPAITLAVAGLLSPMPMFYTNWGRYTQLAGQAILPVTLYMTWLQLDKQKPLSIKDIGVLSILWVGLGLTHYRIFALGVIGMVAYIVSQVRKQSLPLLTRNLGILSLFSTLLFSPWLIRLFEGNIPNLFKAQITQPATKISKIANSVINVGPINTFLPYWLWLALFFSIGYSLWKNIRYAKTISLWILFCFIAANPAWLKLPGSNAISNFAIFIAVYIPAAIFLPKLVSDLLVRKSNHVLWNLTSSVFLILLSVGFLPQRLADIKPLDYAMLTRPDMRAGTWIKENTPEDSRFLINSFSAFVNARVGADGGWWLPISAQRHASVRPLAVDFDQRLPNETKAIDTQIAESIQQRGDVDSSTVLDLFNKRGITHIYIGQQQGRINYSGATLNPDLFIKSPAYELIYHQDAVWVFEIVK